MTTEPINLQIRFRDLDALGHVNNAVYLSYLEVTRVHYFNHLIGKDFDYNLDGLLLARNEIDYKKPVLLNTDVFCKMWCEKIGSKSFVLGYQMFNEKHVYAEAKSIMVGFNSKTNSTQVISGRLLEGLKNIFIEVEQ